MNTDNWLNTRAGQHLANHTIPKLIDALNRNSEALEEANGKKTGEIDQERAKHQRYRKAEQITEENYLDPGEIHWRTQKEINEWFPTPLEVLLYRALSRLYAGDNSEDANAEAIAALSYASNDFRNVLAEHTWNPDGEGDAERIEWNDHTSCIWNDTVDYPGPDGEPPK